MSSWTVGGQVQQVCIVNLDAGLSIIDSHDNLKRDISRKTRNVVISKTLV